MGENQSPRRDRKRIRRSGMVQAVFRSEPGRKIDKAIDREVGGTFYSVIPHPTDGSVWGAMPAPMPGRIVRINPANCAAEMYEPPFNTTAVGPIGYTPRGIDVDSNGVIWTALAGSGHLASFDRRKCKALNGPEATDGPALPRRLDFASRPGSAVQERAR